MERGECTRQLADRRASAGEDDGTSHGTIPPGCVCWLGYVHAAVYGRSPRLWSKAGAEEARRSARLLASLARRRGTRRCCRRSSSLSSGAFGALDRPARSTAARIIVRSGSPIGRRVGIGVGGLDHRPQEAARRASTGSPLVRSSTGRSVAAGQPIDRGVDVVCGRRCSRSTTARSARRSARRVAGCARAARRRLRRVDRWPGRRACGPVLGLGDDRVGLLLGVGQQSLGLITVVARLPGAARPTRGRPEPGSWRRRRRPRTERSRRSSRPIAGCPTTSWPTRLRASTLLPDGWRSVAGPTPEAPGNRLCDRVPVATQPPRSGTCRPGPCRSPGRRRGTHGLRFRRASAPHSASVEPHRLGPGPSCTPVLASPVDRLPHPNRPRSVTVGCILLRRRPCRPLVRLRWSAVTCGHDGPAERHRRRHRRRSPRRRLRRAAVTRVPTGPRSCSSPSKTCSKGSSPPTRTRASRSTSRTRRCPSSRPTKP